MAEKLIRCFCGEVYDTSKKKACPNCGAKPRITPPQNKPLLEQAPKIIKQETKPKVKTKIKKVASPDSKQASLSSGALKKIVLGVVCLFVAFFFIQKMMLFFPTGGGASNSKRHRLIVRSLEHGALPCQTLKGLICL